MTTYGLSSYFITISESITTTSGVSSPSGDTLYLWSQSYNWDENFKLKPKQMLTGGSYTTTKGKVARQQELKKCMILNDDGASTTTKSLNDKLAFMRQFQRITGKQCYLIITNQTDGDVNLKISEDNGVAIDYIKGYILRVRGNPVGGHYELDISFVESTLL